MASSSSLHRAAPEPEAPVAAKRARRGAAVLALQQLVSDDSNMGEVIRSIHATADVVEEDKSGEELSSESAQPSTIQRLEDDVNRLKRNAITDKQTIDRLKTIAERATESSRKRQTEVASASSAQDTIVNLAAMLLDSHVNVLELVERLAKTEAKLASRHKAAVPMCGICHEHNATVMLHKPHSTDVSSQHWFCYECISSYVASFRSNLPGGSIACPQCREHVATIPSVDIATIAANNFNTWKLRDSEVSQCVFGEFSDEERTKALASFMQRLEIPVANSVLKAAAIDLKAKGIWNVSAALDAAMTTLNSLPGPGQSDE